MKISPTRGSYQASAPISLKLPKAFYPLHRSVLRRDIKRDSRVPGFIITINTFAYLPICFYSGLSIPRAYRAQQEENEWYRE